MKKIVVFDFDGTLTTADTLIALLRFARGTGYLIFALLLFSPLLVLMKLHLVARRSGCSASISRVCR